MAAESDDDILDDMFLGCALARVPGTGTDSAGMARQRGHPASVPIGN